MKVCPVCKTEWKETDKVCLTCGWSAAEDVTAKNNLFAETQIADYQGRFREHMDNARRKQAVPQAEDVTAQNHLFADMQIADYLARLQENPAHSDPVQIEQAPSEPVQNDPAQEIPKGGEDASYFESSQRLAENIKNLSVQEQVDLIAALEEWLLAGDEDENHA